jgi:hypothetical protein
MATVNLGSIKFKWKGTYSGATAYTIDDVVEYNGSSYICILASTGNLPTNATYFEQMSSAGTNGTNGTDLGTTLTTQGDLVYRDGSGLQRLGAGTAGQVLQTGGAGANPSWGSLSSDYVKLLTATADNTTQFLDLDNIFDDTTYNHYRIFIRGSGGDGSNYMSLRGRFLDSSGTPVTTSQYNGGFFDHYMNSGTNTFSNQLQWANGEIQFHRDWWSQYGDNNVRNFADITIYDASVSSLKTHYYWRASTDDGSGGSIYTVVGTGYFNTDQSHRGMRFFSGNGVNLYSNFTATVYGIK